MGILRGWGEMRTTLGRVSWLSVVLGTVFIMSISCFGAAELGADMGYLKVRTNPAVPTMISVDGLVTDGWEVKKIPMVAGGHVVSFSDVPGFSTPDPVVVSVSAGDTSTVITEFMRLGALRVISDPALPTTISVDGVPIDDWGAWTYFAPGVHKVTFGPAAGWDVPSERTVRVRSGEMTVVTGVFTPNEQALGPAEGYGLLRVRTDPAVPTTVIVDGIPRDTFGLNWMKIEPGMHEISYTDVPNYVTPENQTVMVEVGAASEVVGEFAREGGLRIVTEQPNSAVIYVDGVARDSWGVWIELPEGIYTVSFGDIPGHLTPPAQTVLVVPGQTTLVVGEY